MKSYGKDLPNTTPEEQQELNQLLHNIKNEVETNSTLQIAHHKGTTQRIDNATANVCSSISTIELQILSKINSLDKKIKQNQKQNVTFLSIITLLCSCVLGWIIYF